MRLSPRDRLALLVLSLVLASGALFATGCSRTGLDLDADAVVGGGPTGSASAEDAAASEAPGRTLDATIALDGSGSGAIVDAAGATPTCDACFLATDAGAIATAYQINAAHTGALDDPGLVPPLAQLWDVAFESEVSYPLVAGGRVYVAAQGGTVAALDARTGHQVWSTTPTQSGYAPMTAYENGRVFALTWTGVLTALDSATGATSWSLQLPNNQSFVDGPPTPFEGVLYIAADGTLYAIAETSGAILWQADVGSGDYCSPAVSELGAFVSNAGPQIYDVDRVTGASIWHYAGPASGGGGETPVLFGGSLYALDPSGPLVLTASTGAPAGTFSSFRTPAFHGNRGFYMSPNVFDAYDVLVARNLTTNAVDWTFPNADAGGYAEPMSSALVVNDFVYAGFIYWNGNGASVAAFGESTGELVWSADVSADMAQYEDYGSYFSLAAGDDILVVPVMDHVVGFASSAPSGDR